MKKKDSERDVPVILMGLMGYQWTMKKTDGIHEYPVRYPTIDV